MLYNIKKNRPSGLGHNMYAVVFDPEGSGQSTAFSVKYISCLEKTENEILCLFEYNTDHRPGHHIFSCAPNSQIKELSGYSHLDIIQYSVHLLNLKVSGNFLHKGYNKRFAFVKFQLSDIESSEDIVSGYNIHGSNTLPIFFCRRRKVAFNKMLNAKISSAKIIKNMQLSLIGKLYDAEQSICAIETLNRSYFKYDEMFANDETWQSGKASIRENIDKIFKIYGTRQIS